MTKIYGVLPVGGNAKRLDMPASISKSMLPQKSFSHYNPIINHSISKMELAGAEKIVFVHSSDGYKDDIKSFFNNPDKYIHILQESKGFANTIKDFYIQVRPNDDDIMFYALSDSVYVLNPFPLLLNYKGTVLGLYTTSDNVKVDRLTKDRTKFQVKSPKNEDNLNLFWGNFKMQCDDIKQLINNEAFEKYTEIGDIFNTISNLKFVTLSDYLDLGNWRDYNLYLDSQTLSNNEVEQKYDASDINESAFIEILDTARGYSDGLHIKTSDHYFTSFNNPNIEFVRYREGNDKGATSDLTIKDFNSSSLNRFELSLHLDKNATSRYEVLSFLSLMKLKFEFEVEKTCHIYKEKDYDLVFYCFTIDDIHVKILEIEIHKADFSIINTFETWATQNLPGFDPNKIIKESKYQIIKKILNEGKTKKTD